MLNLKARSLRSKFFIKVSNRARPIKDFEGRYRYKYFWVLKSDIPIYRPIFFFLLNIVGFHTRVKEKLTFLDKIRLILFLLSKCSPLTSITYILQCRDCNYMLVIINTVIITLFKQKRFIVVSKLINVNVSGLPLMIVALASFVVS